MSSPVPPRDKLGVDAGLGMAVALNGGAVLILFALIAAPEIGYYFTAAVPFLGVVQILYMVPAVIIARRRDQPNVAKGLIIGAVVTFLLNAACWALFTGPWIQY
jgi:hypothetical protein